MENHKMKIHEIIDDGLDNIDKVFDKAIEQWLAEGGKRVPLSEQNIPKFEGTEEERLQIIEEMAKCRFFNG